MTNYIYSIYLIQATRRIILHKPSQSNFTHRNRKFASQEKATRAFFLKPLVFRRPGILDPVYPGKGGKAQKS